MPATGSRWPWSPAWSALALAAPALLAQLAWPLAVGALLAGLPHGAVDHLVPAWARARRLAPRAMTGLLIGYAAVALAMLALLRAAPLPGLAVFLVLSVAHFGSGEVGWAQGAGRQHSGRVATVTAVLAWGGTVVLLPAVLHPVAVTPVLDAFAPGASALLTVDLRWATGAAVLSVVGVTCLREVRLGRARAAAELSLLVLLAAVAPPLVAVAVYFGAWHSVRHVLRLLALDPANHRDLAAGGLLGPLRRFAAQALPASAAALALLGLLLARSGGRTSVLTGDLVLLAALTAPHLVVVAWLDRRVPAAG